MRKETEINVFLKCLSCGTFVTSPSFAAIKKHIDNCKPTQFSSCPKGNVSFDMECDFIDEEMETVTFTQPSLVLKRCQTNILKNRMQRLPRKSRVEASKKLSQLIALENSTKRISKNKNDEDWTRPAGANKYISEKDSKTPKVWFKCNNCSARYNTKPLLDRHKHNVHTAKIEDVFTCPICSRMLKRRTGIAGFHAHLNRHENAEALEKKFNLWKQWATQPDKKHASETFSCKYCLLQHTNHRNFLSHMATDHSDKGQHCSFQCPYNCSTQANSINELVSHFKSAHSEEYLGSPVGEFIVVNGIRKFKCEKCDKFLYPRNMAVHKRSHLNSTPSTRPKGTFPCAYRDCEVKCSSVPFLKFHFVSHLKKNPYVCNFPGCNVKSDAPCHLKQHMKEKHLHAPRSCTKCGVTYLHSRRDKIKSHKCEDNINKLKSGGYKLVDISGFWKLKSVYTKYGKKHANMLLDARLKSAPTPDKNDPNDKVTKMNQYIESLKQIDINSVIRSDPGFIQTCKDNPGFGELILGYHYLGERFQSLKKRQTYVYKCSKCPTMFTGAGVNGFNKHKTLCHGVNGDANKTSEKVRVNTMNMPAVGETQFQIGCPACGKPFKSEDLLEQHLSEDHKPGDFFKCDAPGCGKYCTSANDKARHFTRIHTDRPYRCQKCKLRFGSQASFDKHLEKHRLNPDLGANKNPPCKVCGKVLADLHTRRRHLRLVHGISIPLTGRKSQLKPKKKIGTKKKTIRRKKRTPKIKFKTALKLPDYLQNNEKLAVSVKIEPELTIEPDVIKIETPDFVNYNQIGKEETD